MRRCYQIYGHDLLISLIFFSARLLIAIRTEITDNAEMLSEKKGILNGKLSI